MALLTGEVYYVDAVGDQGPTTWNAAICIEDTDIGFLTIDVDDPKKKGQNICIKLNHIDLMYALGQMHRKDIA